jgi:hypothetical protein
MELIRPPSASEAAVTPPASFICSAVVADDRFTIDDARAHRERGNGFGGQRETIGEIVAISADQVDDAALPMSKDTKAVVLDLVHPAGTCRRLLGRARQAWVETKLGFVQRAGGAVVRALCNGLARIRVRRRNADRI